MMRSAHSRKATDARQLAVLVLLFRLRRSGALRTPILRASDLGLTLKTGPLPDDSVRIGWEQAARIGRGEASLEAVLDDRAASEPRQAGAWV